MAYPSDYRYNPFSDVSTAVLAIERHLIPEISPYVVNLNEVPQKNSPSTMTVKEITAVSGDTVTYGSTFAEVAANPAAGEFWSDYNTRADGDKGWNTGKLLFAASDAGKLVEVSYTATGTLAGVKSNRYPAWWLDRGDGSDGDFYPTANTTISGLKQYRSVIIPAGVTVTATSLLRIQCLGCCIIEGKIAVNPCGASGGGTRGSVGGVGLCSSGGAGGNGGGSEGQPGGGNAMDYVSELPYGGGGGSGGSGGSNATDETLTNSGGRGGGAITITATEVRFTGNISAVGGGGERNSIRYSGGGGGGGGGSVTIIANVIIQSGNINVSGGSGGAGLGSTGKAGAGGSVGITRIKELGVI